MDIDLESAADVDIGNIDDDFDFISDSKPLMATGSDIDHRHGFGKVRHQKILYDVDNRSSTVLQGPML